VICAAHKFALIVYLCAANIETCSVL